MNALRVAAQLLLYVPLMALIGVFSTAPRFDVIAPGEALVRVSLSHATARRHPCRERSAAELSKLPPNMRAAQDCPRERAPLLVEIELDGTLLLRREVPPAGLRGDGAATLSQRLAVAAGRHRVVARLRDRAEGPFNHERAEDVTLAPGGMLLIDFAPTQGGFVFRS